MRHFRSCLVLLLLSSPAAAIPDAAELLAGSIAYHDPQGAWTTGAFRLELLGTRPDGPDQHTVVVIDQRRGLFEIDTTHKEKRVEAVVHGDGSCAIHMDGDSDDPSPEELAQIELDCDRLARWRNYYTYLWGLPMKLRDPGTRLDPQAQETTFDGRAVFQLRVAYAEPIGHDTWYFFLDRQTLALVGYRFYHDEAAGDGETIKLEGEVEGAGLRLPAVRAWYVNQDSRYLGTDKLEAIRALP